MGMSIGPWASSVLTKVQALGRHGLGLILPIMVLELQIREMISSIQFFCSGFVAVLSQYFCLQGPPLLSCREAPRLCIG